MSDEMSVANKEKLVSDLKVVVSDTEELLRSTAGAAGEKAWEWPRWRRHAQLQIGRASCRERV